MALTDLSPRGGGVSGGASLADVANAEVVTNVTLNATDVLNKWTAIPSAPAFGGKVKVYTVHGTVLVNGVDFVINTGLLRMEWTGLSLDGLAASGDQFQLVYLTA